MVPGNMINLQNIIKNPNPMGYHPQHQIQGQVMLNQPSQERHYRNSQDHPGHFRQHGHYHQNQHMGQGGYHNRNMGGHKNKGPGNKSNFFQN